MSVGQEGTWQSLLRRQTSAKAILQLMNAMEKVEGQTSLESCWKLVLSNPEASERNKIAPLQTEAIFTFQLWDSKDEL